jgi:hypothetical protein
MAVSEQGFSKNVPVEMNTQATIEKDVFDMAQTEELS